LIIVVRRVLIHTYQLQDVFFRADIVERVVVHGLGKIDRVEDLTFEDKKATSLFGGSLFRYYWLVVYIDGKTVFEFVCYPDCNFRAINVETISWRLKELYHPFSISIFSYIEKILKCVFQ
jgi:hypothetical protein